MAAVLGGIEAIASLVEHFFPNASDAQKNALAIQLEQDHDLAAAMIAQAAIDTAEANSGNWFASSWRPLVGWVCALSFAWAYLIQPIIVFACSVTGHPLTALPVFDISTMSTVLMGMLGLGAMRSFDKSQGTVKGSR